MPTFPGHGGAWPGRWRWQQVLLLSPQPRSPSYPSPRLKDHREAAAGRATLAWPGPEVPSPGPHPYQGLSLAPSLRTGQGLVCPGPQGPAWGGGAAQREGPVGPALATPGSSVCPRGPPAPAPCPVSATTHRAPPHPPHAPSCQSRCRVWCREISPSGWVGSPSPPLCSLPGAFLCRFLNVILK